jgi:hypothetical protein
MQLEVLGVKKDWQLRRQQEQKWGQEWQLLLLPSQASW